MEHFVDRTFEWFSAAGALGVLCGLMLCVIIVLSRVVSILYKSYETSQQQRIIDSLALQQTAQKLTNAVDALTAALSVPRRRR